MGFRFQRRIKICKGLNINLSKSGIGVSAGVKGAHIGISSKGKPYASVGLPGTGLSYRANLNVPTKQSTNSQRSTIPPATPKAVPTITSPITPLRQQVKKSSEISTSHVIIICILGLFFFIWLFATIGNYMCEPTPSAHPSAVRDSNNTVQQQQEPPKVYTFSNSSANPSAVSSNSDLPSTNDSSGISDNSYRGPDSAPYTEHVNGYYRKNGTYVHSYSRRHRR